MKTMPPERSSLAQAPPRPVHVRVRHGVRQPHNWIQLVKFVAVGGTGYLVNIGVYYLVHEVIGIGHLRSATVAFLVAVFNNFWWNRHWTFGAREGHAGFQAARFFAVSLGALGVNLLVLYGLVDLANAPAVASQAIAIAVAMPFNFIGNKLWTFGQDASASRRR
jgi:dolichol-phosphate mannosyltransferase